MNNKDQKQKIPEEIQEEPVVAQEPKTPEKPKSKCKCLIPIIVIIGIIALGAAAYGIYTVINKPDTTGLPEGGKVECKVSITCQSHQDIVDTGEKGNDGCPIYKCVDKVDDAAKLETYRNETLGIEFKYPSELGTPRIEIRDYTENQQQDFDGKSIDVFFISDTGRINLYFGGVSSDYKARAVKSFTGNNDISLACPKQLSYDNRGNVCKIVQFPLGKVVLGNEFWQAEGSISFYTKIYFNNSVNSEYKGLNFSISLDDVNGKIREEYDFTTNNQYRAYAEAVRQSKNIMEGKNLSQSDEEELRIFNQILSTFKFLD